jgi:DNA replication protein DnaC
MAKSQEHVLSMLDVLRLKHFKELFKKDLTTLLPAEQELILRNMAKWLGEEQAQRKTNQIQSLIRGAQFQKIQTVDNFEFQYCKGTKNAEKRYRALIGSIAADNLPNAIFVGNAGLGKTHLARALGYAACQKGISVLFTTTSAMVNKLAAAQRSYDLESALKRYRKPKVLILDEMGYVNLDSEASNLFFQVISYRHDMAYGTIATTNIPFGEYNRIFSSDAIAHAIVDRLVSQAEIFYFEAGKGIESYRKNQRKKLRRK